MIKCIIISGTSFSEVEEKVNRFFQLNPSISLVKVVNLSDEQYVAMALYYQLTK